MLLDLKLGVLWAVLVGTAFHHPFTLPWILAGILFALLPDIDFWIEYWKRGTVGGKTLSAHRTLLHNPIPYIPAVIVLGVVAGPAWMSLAALGIFGHFIHDSIGMGFGVRWFWPYTEKFYKIFSDRAGNIYYDLTHLAPVSWTLAEVQKVITEKGNDNWLKEDLTYMRQHAPAIIFKFLLFALAIFVLVILFPLA